MTPSENAAARNLLDLAARATAAQRSYSFVSDDRIAHTRSRLVGRVVRSKGLTYTLTVGSRRTQVVRLPHATYVREVPGRWSKLAKPRRLLNPTATLLAVLHRMSATGIAHRRAVRLVTGRLASADAAAAGLPAISRPAAVTVTVSRAGDVVGLRLHATAVVNGQDVAVTIANTYANFGAVAPIRRPV